MKQYILKEVPKKEQGICRILKKKQPNSEQRIT